MFARSPQVIVVPLLEPIATRHALDVACRLAVEDSSKIVVVAPLFVELELPLDAQFPREEAELQSELDRERAAAESYGLGSTARIVRARHGQLGLGLAAVARDASATLIVVGAPVETRRGFRRPFSRNIWSVIQEAPCPVLIAAEPAKADRAA